MSLLSRLLQRFFPKIDDRTFTSAVPVPGLSIEEAEPEQIVELQEMGEDEESEGPTPYELDIFPEDPTVRKKWFSLSIRERQVVALVCMGYRNPDIAEFLGIGHQTILTHMQNIFDKFNLRTRKEIREALISWQAEEWWNYHHY